LRRNVTIQVAHNVPECHLFLPLGVDHFAPESVDHIGPESVVQYDRNIHHIINSFFLGGSRSPE